MYGYRLEVDEMDILTKALTEASIKKYIVTEGLKGEKGDKGDKGDPGDVSLSQLNEVKTDIDGLKSNIAELENVDYHTILSDTYTGTTFTTLNVNVSAGTYIIDVDNIVSADTDASICSVTFIYNTSGNTYIHLMRGSNIHKEITLDNDVNQINIYASDNYAHSAGDTFTFTGFKLYRSYQLIDDITQSRDTRDMVKNLISSISSYETGERVYTSSRLTYPSNGFVVYGNFSGYDTYEYTIDCPTSFKVTGKTKGSSNYLAIGTDNSGNVLQLINQGISGTETQYTDYEFIIDVFGVTKVYICLYVSENDNVQIGVISKGGVSDYDDLTSKPTINNVILTGNKTLSDLSVASEQEVSQIKNLQENAIFSGTYSGTTFMSVSVDIPAGSYVLDINKVTSTDVDDNICSVIFVYAGSGSLTINVPRGNNVRTNVVFENSVNSIYLYAADGYAHSYGDTFSFTGFKIVESYPLMLELDTIKETVNDLVGNQISWENGERTFNDSTFTYATGENITTGTLSDYATYLYNINGTTRFKVTGNIRGADNYLALGANDDGKVLQKIEKGVVSTITPFTDYEFVIDNPNVTKVYICLYKSASDDVKIGIKQNTNELSILFVGNSLTQDGIAYLPYLLKTYYPEIKFRFYMWYNGGYDLSQQYAKFTEDTECEIFSVAENSYSWTNSTKKMSDILSKYRFNIVCMQEYFNRKESYTDADLYRRRFSRLE